MKNKILVVDDEPAICETISDILNDEGYDVITAADGLDAEKKILTTDMDAVILDVMLPYKGGLDLLDLMHTDLSIVPVVIISGHGNIKMAVDAMKRGAYDFIEKPLSMERLISTVRNAVRVKELQTENISLRSKLEKPVQFIGESAAIRTILDKLPSIAQSNASVLITGENGTGKEMIARMIHAQGARKFHAFVGVNCAAIPENLIESELFGHEKGSFTGAHKQKKGKFEAAHKGTIFLDEVGDLSLTAQAKVLRVLQERELERVGGNEIVKVDVCVLAATNKDLTEAIRTGKFRQDLYYRLNVIPVQIPSLRERKDDIPPLIDFFIEEFAGKNGREVKISKPAVNLLINKTWPGNVRELRNFVQRLIVLTPSPVIEPEDVLKCSFPEEANLDTKYENQTLKDAKHQFEKGLIINRLIKCGMNITKAAESLEIERTYLHKKIKELEIDKELEFKE